VLAVTLFVSITAVFHADRHPEPGRRGRVPDRDITGSIFRDDPRQMSPRRDAPPRQAAAASGRTRHPVAARANPSGRRDRMTLPAGQQRALDRIEDALQAVEPRMAARFDVFTRLTHGEDFPRSAEQLERPPRRLLQFLARHLPRRQARAGRGRRRPRGRLATRSRAMLLLPFALLAMTLALLGSSATSAQACGTARSRFASPSSRERTCPSGSSRPTVRPGLGPGGRAAGYGSRPRPFA
jgi:hypothetical protein